MILSWVESSLTPRAYHDGRTISPRDGSCDRSRKRDHWPNKVSLTGSIFNFCLFRLMTYHASVKFIAKRKMFPLKDFQKYKLHSVSWLSQQIQHTTTSEEKRWTTRATGSSIPLIWSAGTRRAVRREWQRDSTPGHS